MAWCIVTQPPNDIVALDAKTGRMFWIYQYKVSPDARVCCGRINRGLAILGNTLYMGTIDAHLVAVDARNGRPHLGCRAGGAQAGLRGHSGAAGGQGQSDRRHRRRRAGHRRLHRGLSTLPPARNSGVSRPSPDRASRATRPGAAIPGSTAPARCGSPALTIPISTWSTGAPAIRAPTGIPTSAPATTCTPAPPSRSTPIPAS